MALAMTSSTLAPVAARPVAARRQARAVRAAVRPVGARRATAVCAADKPEVSAPVMERLAAPVGAAALAMAAMPAPAQAAETASLEAFLGSIVAGALVLGAILGAVAFVSTFDRVDVFRK